MDEIKLQIRNILSEIHGLDPNYDDVSAIIDKAVDEIIKLKNLGEGEAGTGYALLSDGWRDGITDKPDDREEVLVCIISQLPENKFDYDYFIGMYRQEMNSVVERWTGDKYEFNISCYKWKRLTVPSF